MLGVRASEDGHQNIACRDPCLSPRCRQLCEVSQRMLRVTRLAHFLLDAEEWDAAQQSTTSAEWEESAQNPIYFGIFEALSKSMDHSLCDLHDMMQDIEEARWQIGDKAVNDLYEKAASSADPGTQGLFGDFQKNFNRQPDPTLSSYARASNSEDELWKDLEDIRKRSQTALESTCSMITEAKALAFRQGEAAVRVVPHWVKMATPKGSSKRILYIDSLIPMAWSRHHENTEGYQPHKRSAHVLQKHHLNPAEVRLRCPLVYEAASKQGTPRDHIDRTHTLYIRNLPRHYVKNILLRELKYFGWWNTFDFLQLPMDPRTRNLGLNKGYAIINFVSWKWAYCFRKRFNGARLLQSGKRARLLDVVEARIQGYEANQKHYCKWWRRRHRSGPDI